MAFHLGVMYNQQLATKYKKSNWFEFAIELLLQLYTSQFCGYSLSQYEKKGRHSRTVISI